MKKEKNRRAVFLDRDGTLIEDMGYNCDPEKIFPLDGVLDGLKKLSDNGYTLVVITNQSGVARGYFSIEELERMNTAFEEVFSRRGIRFAGVYSCIHAPNAECPCRKPNPGLLMKAAKELCIHIPASVMIGDKISDVEAGIAAGCGLNILLDSHGKMAGTPGKTAFKIAKNFKYAVKIILEDMHDSATG